MGISHPTSAPPAIQPYWERFPSFFFYPISMESLPATLGFVIGTTLFLLLAKMLFLIFIIVIGILLLFVRHAFSVLDHTSQGFFGETIAHDASHLSGWIAFKHGFAITLGVVLVGSLATFSQALAVLTGLVLLFAWPANVMLLARSGNFGESINPAMLFETITAIGIPYLGLWACLALLSTGSGTAHAWMSKLVSNPMLATFIDTFITFYFMLVMFRLMGYVVYQYHEALGFKVAVAATPTGKPQSEQDVTLANCNAAVAAGKFDEAMRILNQGMDRYPNDIALLNAQLRLKLASGQHAPSIEETARHLMNLHFVDGKYGQAIAIIEQVASALPDLAPKTGRDTFILADAAFKLRKAELAGKLIRSFDKRYPKNEALPEVMLLAARILCEHHRNDQQARSVLQQLLRHYPKHPCRPDAEQMLVLLDRLSAGTAS